MKPLGIQLYSVREAAAKDFVGVIRQVAAIGYKGVEFAGLHEHKPAEIRKVLDDLGLVASSSHAGVPTKETRQEIIDTAGALGYRMVIASRGPDGFKTMDDIRKGAEEFQAGAELLKGTGLKMGYHNHWWEMNAVDGRRGLDVFLKLAPGVFSQTDVYWASNFGTVDVPALVRQYAKRIPCLHIKDGPLVQGQPHTAVGKGRMDMAPIIAAANPKVLEWLIVELDECATDMMQAVRDSYAYLTGEGLAEGNV